MGTTLKFLSENTVRKCTFGNSDACTMVQFRRDPAMCKRHAVDGCEACWDEELGRENANK